MKIIVYNYHNQFALSRKQIEAMQKVLPNEYFASIREFHITTDSSGQERFEYDYDSKTAHFEYKIEQKTIETTKDAVEHVLVGLKRIKQKDVFGHLIRASERTNYEAFINAWRTKCLTEFENLKTGAKNG